MSSSTPMTIFDIEGRNVTAPMSARQTSACVGLRI